MIDAEFEFDAALPGLSKTFHALNAFDTGELFFLAFDDFAFNFARRRTLPRGVDLDDRLADIRSQLNRNGLQGDQAHDDQNHHGRENGDGSFNA